MSGCFSKARPSKRKKVFCAGTHLLQQSESTVSSHINSSSDDVCDLPNEPCTSEAAKVPDAVMDPDELKTCETSVRKFSRYGETSYSRGKQI